MILSAETFEYQYMVPIVSAVFNRITFFVVH